MTRVRVLTINVQNTEGDPRRQQALNRELRRIDPDIVAFQEVMHTEDRDQLAELLDASGLQGTHQAEALSYTPEFADRYGGSAVATRWPHRVLEVLDLRLAGASDLPWFAMAVAVPIPGEGDVLFIAATSSWRLNAEASREQQAVALTDLDARHRTELPSIVAGDFNANPDAASIRYLTGLQSLGGHSVCYHDAWAVAGEGPGYTWTTDNPVGREAIDQIVGQPGHRRRMDYVFVGSWDAHPRAHGRVCAAQLAFDESVDGVWPSDHFGVLVEVEIAAAA
jgi:endonuclease/exonuclease/phosphatase family metal-dependent hydrolase